MEFKEEYFPIAAAEINGLVRDITKFERGIFYVDSGQFMVSSLNAREQVVNNDVYRDKRVFKHADGRLIPTSCAGNWMEPALDGKSLNQLRQEGLLVVSREPRADVLGYELACDITLSETPCDVALNTVFSSTCYGDGRYPVYVSNDANCVVINTGFSVDRKIKDTDLAQQIGEINVTADETTWTLIDPCYKLEDIGLGILIDLNAGTYTVYRMCISESQDITEFNAILLIKQ